MSLRFDPKPPVVIESEVSNLFYFTKSHAFPYYLEFTMQVIFENTEANSTKPILKVLELHTNRDKISSDVDIAEFDELMLNFYDTTKDILKKRRGDFLEITMREINPSEEGKTVQKKLECYVYNGREKLSEKDIDLVWEWQSKASQQVLGFDLFECKVTLPYILIQIKPVHRDKLSLMVNIKNLIEQDGKTCMIYLPTFCSQKEFCEETLRNLGFLEFNVWTPKDIIHKLE